MYGVLRWKVDNEQKTWNQFRGFSNVMLETNGGHKAMLEIVKSEEIW